MIITLILILMFILLFVGMPIGFVLLSVGSLGIFLVGGLDTLEGILTSSAFRAVNSFTLTTIPLFILMAHFISNSKIADDLYNSILKWIGHLPGGVGVATIFSSAGFGAISGSSIAATSIMSSISVPQMIKAKYSPPLASGLAATITGTVAVMIPPSIPLVLYGIQTETQISKLFMAGLIPGILISFIVCVYVVVVSYKNDTKVDQSTWQERWTSLAFIWPISLLMITVIGFIYLGIGTTTEAAAIGSLGALLIGLIYKRLNLKLILKSLKTTVRQTSMIFTIIVGAQFLTYFITLTGIGDTLIDIILNSGLSKWYVLILIVIMYLIIGMFIDPTGTMLLTLPLIFPIIINLGFDPVWFGVILVLLLEIGLVTPPVGMNLFITSQASDVPVQTVIKGSLPFIALIMLAITLLILFPQLVLMLPTNL